MADDNARPRRRGDSALPAGVRRARCSRCGFPVWRARIDPEASRLPGWRSRVIMLEPHRAGGGVILTSAGLAVFSGRFPGEFSKHNCPGRVAACKYCGRPVRVLNAPPGPGERLAVVDADPDPGGPVGIDAGGYATRDPGGGPRYRWHAKHESSTAALMREVPGGAR